MTPVASISTGISIFAMGRFSLPPAISPQKTKIQPFRRMSVKIHNRLINILGHGRQRYGIKLADYSRQVPMNGTDFKH